MTKELSIENITKIYHSKNKEPFVANDNITFSLAKGDILGLLGHNGAGKTTLIKMIAGLAKPDFGIIKINGKNVHTNLQTIKFNIGIVNQDIDLDVFFTVRETLELQSLYFGIQNNKTLIEYLLDVMDLKHKQNAKIRSLSGGMKRRLMIAKALVHDPNIIILDEPTAGVDFAVKKNIMLCIKNLQKAGKTIIIITHHFDEINKLCNLVAVLNKGQLCFFDHKSVISDTISEKKLEIYFTEKINPEELKQIFSDLEQKHEKEFFVKENSILILNKKELLKSAIDRINLNKDKLEILRIHEHNALFEERMEALLKRTTSITN